MHRSSIVLGSPQWILHSSTMHRCGQGHRTPAVAVKRLGSYTVLPKELPDAYGKASNIVQAPRGLPLQPNDSVISKQFNQEVRDRGLEIDKQLEKEKVEEEKRKSLRRESSADTSSSQVYVPSTRASGETGNLQRSRPSSERKSSRRSARKQSSPVQVQPQHPPAQRAGSFQLTREDEVELCLAIQVIVLESFSSQAFVILHSDPTF